MGSEIDVAYFVVGVMGRQMVLMDESGETHNVNVQDFKITHNKSMN